MELFNIWFENISYFSPLNWCIFFKRTSSVYKAPPSNKQKQLLLEKNTSGGSNPASLLNVFVSDGFSPIGCKNYPKTVSGKYGVCTKKKNQHLWYRFNSSPPGLITQLIGGLYLVRE